MMVNKSSWQKVKLGDLLEKVVDNRGKTPPLSDFGYPMVEVYQLSRESKYPNVKYDSKQKYVSESTYNNWFRAGHPKSGDLLMSTVGTISQWNLVPENSKYCIAQNVVALRPKPEKISAEFLRHYFNQRKFIGQVQGIAIGAAQPSVRLPHFLSIEVSIPEKVTEQKKILSILSAFDDKIEVNNKIAKTLEEMAQAIFKEWFVNYHSKTWELSKFENHARLEYGKALQEDKRVSGDVLVFGSSGQVGTHNEKLVDGPGIVVGRKGNVGSVFWIDRDFYPIDTTFYVSSSISLYYIYFILKNMRFHTGDSAVPGLNRESVHSFEILIPEKSILDKFDAVIAPIFEKQSEIKKENQKLAALRDLLLPKLMSGEVRV